MYQTLVLLVALAQLGHAVAGCCWHHAHSSDAECCSSPVQVTEHHCCCAHPEQAPSHDNHEPSEHHLCDGSQCVFVCSEPSPQQTGDLKSDFYVPVPVVVSLSLIARKSSCQSAGRGLLFADDCLPLRAHLLFGVLLV